MNYSISINLSCNYSENFSKMKDPSSYNIWMTWLLWLISNLISINTITSSILECWVLIFLLALWLCLNQASLFSQSFCSFLLSCKALITYMIAIFADSTNKLLILFHFFYIFIPVFLLIIPCDHPSIHSSYLLFCDVCYCLSLYIHDYYN